MPNVLVPPRRPDITRMEVRALMKQAGIPEPHGTYLFARRGYYRDTMGKPGENDRGIYDDALVLVTPSRVITFNANTDPSRVRPGMAMLRAGVWLFEVGTHNRSKEKHRQYEALIQAAPLTVERDARGPDTGWFGVNIHRGGSSGTSSEGCVTVVPSQWLSFLDEVKRAMRLAGIKKIPLVLTVRPDDA